MIKTISKLLNKNKIHICLHAFNYAGENDSKYFGIIHELYKDHKWYVENKKKPFHSYLKANNSYCMHNFVLKNLNLLEKLNSGDYSKELKDFLNSEKEKGTIVVSIKSNGASYDPSIILLKYENDNWVLENFKK